MTNLTDKDDLVLASGAHERRDDGVCLMEAVAWWAGEDHSDRPECASPVLAAFGRKWNDCMRSDEEREQLRHYIPLLPGTAGDREADLRRGWMATDWLVRTFAPKWLRLAGLDKHADRLATLPQIVDERTASAAQSDTGAAWDAARDAARIAAGDAARAAAWAAARDATRDAARDAARAAADDAAEAAWYAAEEVLEPTVKELQASAHKLFRRMIAA